MTEPDRIRISDRDRELYSDRLRTAYAEGRLTEHELEERLSSVYRARFGSDLDAVTADLPVPVDDASPDHLISARSGVGRVIRSMAQWYFPALICTGIWAITSFGGYFWPIWVFFGLTIPFISSLIFDDDDNGDEDNGEDEVIRG